jgi:exopolysaccharide production protein ExoZ
MEAKNEGLQAGRAIAALSVAYFHSYVAIRAAFPETAWLPIPGLKDWGFLGVNLFFAISGYVICLVTTRPSFAVREFVIKRIFRLYPMYWVAMAVVVGLISIGKYSPSSLGHFLYSMALLPQAGPSVYDVSWTLERELVFYALAAAVVPIGGIAALAVTLAMLAALGWWFGDPWSFHLISVTQANFLAGVLVFMARRPLQRLGGLVPLGAGCLLLAYTRIHDFAFSVSLSMAIILAGLIHVRLPWSRAPLRWLVLAGDASYSIYLLHYLVFFTAANISVRLLSMPTWMAEPWRFISILACCFLSYGTWRLVERPMIDLGNRLARSTGEARSLRLAPPVTD